MTGQTGNFIWYELMTTDSASALAFYSDVIGWTAAKSDMTGMDYWLLSMGGEMVCGLMEIPANARAEGMQPAWVGYVNVADVDAGVKGFTEAGGAVHMPPTDIAGVGRMAMVTDPQGAALYLMTPAGDGGSQSFAPGKAGHGGWHELHTKDWEAAIAFYAAQFGWAVSEVMDMGPGGKYVLFHAGGDAIGGMVNTSDKKPVWFYYFCVDDIDAAQRRVTAARGAVLSGPHQVPGGSWIVQAKDSQGAMFQMVGPRPH